MASESTPEAAVTILVPAIHLPDPISAGHICLRLST